MTRFVEASIPLVIGVGNDFRGDDAAGLRAVRELGPRLGNRARVVESGGGVAELLDLWEGRDQVFLIDAVRSGRPEGTWHRMIVDEHPLPASLAGTSTHGLSVASAVELGRLMGRMPRTLVMYGIEARRFEPGTVVSPPVLEAIHQVTLALAEEIGLSAPQAPAAGER